MTHNNLSRGPVVRGTASRGTLAARRETSRWRGRIGALLLAATVIFLHLMFVQAGGYPLTVAPFAVVFFVCVAYELRLPLRVLALWSLLVVLPFLNLAIFAFSVDGIQPTEFAKTYCLWVFAITVLLVASKAPIRGDVRLVGRAAFLVVLILAVYSAAQVLSFDYLSTDVLFNPFGDHQYLYQYDVELYAYDIRAPGFYLEPSYNAFVVTSMIFVTLASNYRPAATLAIGAIAVLATQSMSGMLVYACVLLAYLLSRGAGRRVWVGVTLLIFIFTVFYFFGVGSYLLDRTSNASVEGTSTYFRMVAPLTVIKDVLTNSVTGLPFGEVERVMSDYGLLNGETVGSTLDNGVYLMIFYFGWLAIAATVLAVLTGVLFFGKQWTPWTFFLLGYVFLSMFYSGGIMSPEYIYVIVLAIFAWRAGGGAGRRFHASPQVDAAFVHRTSHPKGSPNESYRT